MLTRAKLTRYDYVWARFTSGDSRLPELEAKGWPEVLAGTPGGLRLPEAEAFCLNIYKILSIQ